ncbi:MAG: radical SAM protein [archaeon]|jgi:MoaA/NifB/PqqE/SkfB family radical SAM enzyme
MQKPTKLKEKMPFPKHIVIELTELCNLNCPMCWLHGISGTKKHQIIQKEITVKQICAFLDTIKKKPLYIRLTGGEPLTKPDFFQLLEFIKQKGHVCGRISTNGTLIGKKQAKKIVQLGVQRITISIDGNKKIHDNIRGKGTFDKAIKAIKLINEAKRKLKRSNPEIEILCTISKLNADTIESVAELGSKLQVKTIFHLLNWTQKKQSIKHRAHLLNYFGIKDNTAIAFAIGLNKLPSKKLAKHLIQLKNNYLENKVLIRPICSVESIDDWYSNQKPLFGRKICSAPFSIFRIGADGNNYPCRFLRVPIGNIQQSAEEIWNSTRAKKIRKLFLTKKRLEICKRCSCFG